MSLQYREITDLLKAIPPRSLGTFNPGRYLGTHSAYIGLSTKEVKQITRDFKKNHPDITFVELLDIVAELNNGHTFEEKVIGAFLLMIYADHLKKMRPSDLKPLLETRQGWCEIDVLCQSTFDGAHLLADWNTWKTGLTQFSKEKNISLRRASLVLLCKPLRTNDDPRIYDLALENVERLKGEKDILITKAISWVLRSMIKHHKKDVAEYLKKNEASLPRIAVRETKKKLETGRKNG